MDGYKIVYREPDGTITDTFFCRTYVKFQFAEVKQYGYYKADV